MASCSASVGDTRVCTPPTRHLGQSMKACPSRVTVGRRGESQCSHRPYLQGRDRTRPAPCAL
eukprot:12176030-Alexandrium_andersonii.AAC.1